MKQRQKQKLKDKLREQKKRRLPKDPAKFFTEILRIKPYHYQAELNVVQWEQRPGSEIYSFSHPQGTHDDQFWAIALACVASTGAEPAPEVWVVPR